VVRAALKTELKLGYAPPTLGAEFYQQWDRMLTCNSTCLPDLTPHSISLLYQHTDIHLFVRCWPMPNETGIPTYTYSPTRVFVTGFGGGCGTGLCTNSSCDTRPTNTQKWSVQEYSSTWGVYH
jgi:hypothetical protein